MKYETPMKMQPKSPDNENEKGTNEKSFMDAFLGPKDEEKLIDVDFMSPVHSAYHKQPKRTAPIMLISIVSFFAILIIWASLAELDETTRADAKVIPSGQTKIIDHLEGGIIRDILVREGQNVEKGQVLIKIDNIVAQARYEEARTHYYQAILSVERLKAQISGTSFEPAQNIVQNAPKDTQDAIARYNTELQNAENQTQIATQEVGQKKQELADFNSRVYQAEKRLEISTEELAMTEQAVKSGASSKAELLRQRKEVNAAQGEIASNKANVARSEAALQQAEEKLGNVHTALRAQYYNELQDAQRRLAEAKDSMTTEKDRLTRTEIVSPVRGTIKELFVHTIGGVIQPGTDMIAIVPLEDNLIVEADVRPKDVAFIHPDMPATVKITAYDFSIYGGLDGKVIDISADAILNQEKRESFFRVRVKTDKNHLGTDAKPLQIIPGMTATVDILTGKKTVLQYLMKPLTKASLALHDR